MAVEDAPTQSTQQSTQPASPEASQDVEMGSGQIWGSLIPFNPDNTDITRIDFVKSRKKYIMGRSRKKTVNDISFPYCSRMSQTHCAIEWDGEETSKSAVVISDLNSSNGTYINGRRLISGEHTLLRDWAVVSFGPPRAQNKTGRPREDYRFFFRLMAFSQGAREGLYEHYDVHHVLGRGAYATVVKAFHRKEKKWYAVKMFSADRLRELLTSRTELDLEQRMKKTAAHLRQEIDILKKLKHHFICQLKDAFFEGYSVSLVLELAPGGDLTSYVLKHVEPEAQYFTFQICDALAYVHKQGVVHRDLKPDNILLTDDHPPIIKVSDFGLAKVIDSLSTLQTRCGTLAFVAPEVLDQSTEGYDKVVDSWSLGVMVFMLITKSSPFSDDDSSEPNWALLREFNISETGEDFLRRLLEHNPRKRMTSAEALEHAWLAPEAPRQRARMLERERSLAAREAAAAENSSAQQSKQAQAKSLKRKRGIPGALERSLSTLSVEDAEDVRGAKRTRAERGLIIRPATAPRMGWTNCDLDADEIPGLGLWREGV